jgi:putative RNA 2'-phosphotransferase
VTAHEERLRKLAMTDLSRAVSHALRHEPWLYELELDDEGWVSVDALLEALRKQRPEWASLSERDLCEMIAVSEKKRHELRNRRIRALYGHSTPGKLLKEATEPPVLLYHGTSPEVAAIIKTDGLRPMGRQYVHLSADLDTAERVGNRKSRTPVIFIIEAKRAHDEGIAFYRGNASVWLADYIPAGFMKQR